MTDLSRVDIKNLRHHYGIRGDDRHVALCDMALAKKDAEAECERLRERERQLYDALWTLDGHARLYMTLAQNVDEQTRAALDTPPPEGEPCDVCGGEGRRAFPNANNTIVHHPFCTACKGTGKAPNTPKQAHGDALPLGWAISLMDAVVQRGGFVSDDGYPDDGSVQKAWNVARQALTASGVPYVPEEVRRIAKLADTALIPETVPHTLEPLVWRVREIKRGADKALASAPAVHPDYPRATMDELRKVYGIVLRYIDRLNDPISEPEFNLDAAQMCDELEDAIAAAPTDGRE